MKSIRKSYFHLTLVSCCLFIVFFMGVSNLKSDPIGNAESNTLKHLFPDSLEQTLNVFETIASVSLYSDEHGPLYFVLLNYWSGLAGNDLFALRLLSVYFGLLTVAVACRLAMLTRDVNVAVNAVLITSFMAFFIFYTHELRMYSLIPFFSGWIAWSYWQVLSSRGQRGLSWKQVSLFISTALILYVHYFGITILVAIGIYHLLFVPKNRHWFQISSIIMAGGLMFLPWLQIVIQSLATRTNIETYRLVTLESLRVLTSIYSNGLWFIPIGLGVLILWNFKCLAETHKYLLFLTCSVISAMLLINEFTPILVEHRMRYTTAMTALITCSAAIGLIFIPKKKLIQFPLLCLWAASFFLFTDSTELYVYTNRQRQDQDAVPHYQNFLYSPSIAEARNEAILSLHRTKFGNKARYHYYRALSDWKSMIHIFYDEQNKIAIQSPHPEFRDLDGIVAGNNAIWLIHNPQQTNLQTMPVYTEWFTRHYKSCKRFFENDNAIIDYYVRVPVPCELIDTQNPFEVLYDNGIHLSNLLEEIDSGQLTFYFWWSNTVRHHSFSIQIFDERGEKVQQYDDAIGAEPLDIHTIDISMLDKSDYAAKLIVYDFVTKISQPGTVLSSQQRFEREIEIPGFAIGD